MTLSQCVTSALKRAEYCKSRRKKYEHHLHEAALTVGRILAAENQKRGKSYKREVLRVLSKPTQGVRALSREKQGRLF